MKKVGIVVGLLIVFFHAAAAFADPPSNAAIKFRVGVSVSQDDGHGGATIPGYVYWTPGSSPYGAGCCTSKVLSDGKFLSGSTTQSKFPVTMGTGSGLNYEVESWDANGSFVGSAIVDPEFQPYFEDVYVADDSCFENGSIGCGCPHGLGYGFSGSWSVTCNPSNYDGGSTTSTTAGDSYTFSSDIANGWVTTTGPKRGSAAIYVDGVYQATVSTYSAKQHFRRVVWQMRFGTLGGHTITIVNLATPGHPRIDVDGYTQLTED